MCISGILNWRKRRRIDHSYTDICHSFCFLCVYCSGTYKTANNQTQEKEKFNQQHIQQQCWEQHKQHQQQEKSSCCKPESFKSATCKSHFPCNPPVNILLLILFHHHQDLQSDPKNGKVILCMQWGFSSPLPHRLLKGVSPRVRGLSGTVHRDVPQTCCKKVFKFLYAQLNQFTLCEQGRRPYSFNTNCFNLVPVLDPLEYLQF